MEECPGQRDGSTIYYFDGHMYRKNRSTESSSYFRCATRGCMGRVIHKHRLGTIVAVSPHNHDADPHKHNLRRFLAAMQRRVNLETIPIHEIYLQEASRFPGIEEVMPYQSLQLQMEKRRRLHEINEMNQSTEMKQLHFLNLCDIEDMTKSIRAREAQDPLFFNASGGSMQQMQEQSGSRDDPSSLEATFGMGGAAGMTDHPEAGPSGYMDDDVRVKMEPEWVDAGALEPNCELEGQFEDNQDFNASYSEAGLSGADNQNFQMYNSQQQPQSQQLPLIQDAQDPVKLHVPGKPNLTITVAPTRQGPSQSSNTSISTPPPPPLHLLNPLLNRKRGRPRGSAYGSYSESDDRVTTILTDSIIASQKLEKMGVTAASAYRPTPVNASAMPSSLVKPRSRDPEAVRAAEIVNGAQNRSGPRVTEELEKVHLKLRQEVLALEVQNLKAEREKLKAYRRNVAIRREIMALHLQLGKGFPSECASSGRGFETMDTYDNFMDTDCDVDFSPPTKDPISLSKKLPNVSITRQQAGQSPKISIRKSLQTSSQSPNASPMSMSSSTKGVTPPPASVNKPVIETKDQGESSQSSGNKRTHTSDNRQTSTGRQGSDNRSPVDSVEDQLGSKYEDNHKPSVKSSSDHQNNQENESKGSGENCSQSGDTVKDELVPLDSVSSDLSIEMLSEPGSSQWTTQSSAPMTEHEGFDDIHFEGDDSYDNTGSIGEFSGEPVAKEPPDGQYSSFAEDPNSHKRRRVENMWEPDEPL